MEKREFTVTISEEMIQPLEQSWYELQADQSTVAFCMAQPTVNFEAVKSYRDVIAKEYATTEMLKHQIAKAVKPEEVDLKKFNYSYDFDERTVTFTEA